MSFLIVKKKHGVKSTPCHPPSLRHSGLDPEFIKDKGLLDSGFRQNDEKGILLSFP